MRSPCETFPRTQPVTALLLRCSSCCNLDDSREAQQYLEASSFSFWDTNQADLEDRYWELPASDNLLKGNQSHWIAAWKPVGTYAACAAAGKTWSSRHAWLPETGTSPAW
jgi:hypothetical protein